MNDLELTGVSVLSGVNDKGVGFCTIVARGTDKTVLMGQLTPAEVRAMALGWLSAAEAAEQDAAVLRAFRNLNIGDSADLMAATIITELRQARDA